MGQARHLRDQFASPAYLMDVDGLLSRFDEFQSQASAAYPNNRVAVSYKTNPTRALLEQLHKRGAYAEVVSADELEIAISLNVPANKIIFNGPNKSERAIAQAIEGGSTIHCDHFDEIEKIDSIARALDRDAKIGLRLFIPGDDSWERFGFRAEIEDPNCEAVSAARTISQSKRLILCGYHAHLGTNIRNLMVFEKFSRKLAQFVEYQVEAWQLKLEWIDVGGGLAGIAPLVSENRFTAHPLPSIEDYVRAVVNPLLPILDRYGQPRLYFEPGRTLFNAFGGLLTSVLGRRPPIGKEDGCLVLDAGITSLALAHKYNHLVHACVDKTEQQTVRLLGPTCMDWDVVSRPMQLPQLSRDDLVILYGTGCYSMALGSAFTHFRPGIIGWSGDTFKWLRKPDSLEHSSTLDVMTDPNHQQNHLKAG